MSKILIAGESWMSYTTHVKGFDSFTTSIYEEGIAPLRSALEKEGHEVTFLPNHIASEQFPYTEEEMSNYDVIILSDIGSNTLLLSKRVFTLGLKEPNRLDEICKYVNNGGSFLMIGGYMSFTGIDAKTRYGETSIKNILPISMLKNDDREEIPQGIYPTIIEDNHEIFESIDEPFPYFLGYNKTIYNNDLENSKLLATINNDPFIAVREVGKGKTAIFSSDCAPHWGSKEFISWRYYDRLWNNIINFLTTK